MDVYKIKRGQKLLEAIKEKEEELRLIDDSIKFGSFLSPACWKCVQGVNALVFGRSLKSIKLDKDFSDKICGLVKDRLISQKKELEKELEAL